MGDESQKILDGFQINWVILRDAESGEVLWCGNEDYSCGDKVYQVRLPKRIVKHKRLLREIHFSSLEGWRGLRLVHTVLYKGLPLDEWTFQFGPVAPGLSTTWQSLLVAAPEADLIDPDILNGHVLIITKFFNDDQLITVSKIKVYYS